MFNRLSSTGIILLFTFVVFFLVELNTPFQSDDFGYVQLGSSFSQHLDHYLNWSGRLVSDYSSSLLLNYNHIIVSLVIAFLATLTCFIISDLPNRLLDKPFSNLKFIFLSCLYWIAHPDIGEGIFWVVGACNYLVTTCFVLVFLYSFVVLKASDNYLTILSLFVLSVFAGCSNENTSISCIFVFMVLLCYFKFTHLYFDKKLAICVGFGLLIGTCILILSPGNFARLADPLYAEWRNYSVLKKILVHLIRFRKIFNYAFIILIVLYIYNFVKSKKIFIEKKEFHVSCIFLITSLFAFFVLFVSPSMPRRAFTSVFVFQLLALSCIIYPVFTNRITKVFAVFVFGFVFCTFVLSYVFVLNSYAVTKIQESIRNDHIYYEKLVKGNDISIEIPSYYFVRLLRQRDDFDLFHSEAHASYEKVREITVKEIDCDYSIIADPDRKISVDNKSKLASVDAYYKQKSFLSSKSHLVLESQEEFPEDLSIMCIGLKESSVWECKPKYFFRIKDKYYAALSGDFENVTSVLIK